MILLVSTTMLARLLGPEELGTAALSLSIAYVFMALAERAFHDVVIQLDVLNPAHKDTAQTLALLLGTLLAILLFFLAAPIARLYADPIIELMLKVLALNVVFSALSSVEQAWRRREHRFDILALKAIIGASCGAVVGVIMALHGYGAWSLIAQHVVFVVTASVILLVTAGRFPRYRISLSHLRYLAHFSSVTTLTELLRYSTIRFFVSFVGYIGGSSLVAHIEIASRLINAVRNTMLNTLNPVAMTVMSRLQNDHARLRRFFIPLANLNIVLITPIYLLIFVLADELVLGLLGPEWIEAAVLFKLLAIANLGLQLQQFSSPLFVSVGRPHYNLRIALVAFLVIVVASVVMQPNSVWSAGWVLILRALATIPITGVLTINVLSASHQDFLKGITLPLLASTAMIISVLLLAHWLPLQWHVWTRLITLSVTGAVVYVLFLLVFARAYVERNLAHTLRFAAARV